MKPELELVSDIEKITVIVKDKNTYDRYSIIAGITWNRKINLTTKIMQMRSNKSKWLFQKENLSAVLSNINCLLCRIIPERFHKIRIYVNLANINRLQRTKWSDQKSEAAAGKIINNNLFECMLTWTIDYWYCWMPLLQKQNTLAGKSILSPKEYGWRIKLRGNYFLVMKIWTKCMGARKADRTDNNCINFFLFSTIVISISFCSEQRNIKDFYFLMDQKPFKLSMRIKENRIKVVDSALRIV